MPLATSVMSFSANTVNLLVHGETWLGSTGSDNLYAVKNCVLCVKIMFYIFRDGRSRTPENGYNESQSGLFSSITIGLSFSSVLINSDAISSTSLWNPGAPSAADKCRCRSFDVI